MVCHGQAGIQVFLWAMMTCEWESSLMYLIWPAMLTIAVQPELGRSDLGRTY